jgi:hypothetical protein
MWQYFSPHTVEDIHENSKMFNFEEKVLPINSEVLVHLKNLKALRGA